MTYRTFFVLRFSFSNGPDDVGRWQRATFFLFFFFFSSRGPLLDWFGQIMLYSHWSTQTWRSTNACVPATDLAVVCTLIEPSNAGAYWAMPHSDFLVGWAVLHSKFLSQVLQVRYRLSRTLNPAKQGLSWAMPHSYCLAWLSSATLKIFIWGVSCQIPLIQVIEPSNAGA